MSKGRETAVWLAPEQVEFVRAVAEAGGLRITAAGSPVRGQGPAVAAALVAAPVDDLRGMLSTADAELVWIASPGAFGAAAGDADALLSASERGVRIAASEPIPASALDLSSGGWLAGVRQRPADVVRVVPSARDWSSIRQVEDVLEQFGHIRTVSVEWWSSPVEGSLGARLFGAISIIQTLLGEPETISAAFVSPGHGIGVHPLPGESLRGLEGELCACVRMADGRAATITVGDRGGRWHRSATIVGAGGRLRLSDRGVEWIGPSGEAHDDVPPLRPAESTRDPAPAAFAEALNRVVELGDAHPSALVDNASLLAIAQAALLSARTGEPESPGTIRHMVGAV